MTSERPTAREPTAATDERTTDDGTPPFTCPYCEREFARTDYRDLHLGLEHPDALLPAERAAYETAREVEEEALTLFRYKALGLLVLIYFGFLMLYAVSL